MRLHTLTLGLIPFLPLSSTQGSSQDLKLYNIEEFFPAEHLALGFMPQNAIIESATFTGNKYSVAKFQMENGPGSDNGIILEDGIVLTTTDVREVYLGRPDNLSVTTYSPGNAICREINGGKTSTDVQLLTVLFHLPKGVNKLKAHWVFSSEEYGVPKNQRHNDAFGIWIDGVLMTKDSKGQPINMESDIWNGNVTRTPASGNSFEGSTPRMFAYSQNLTDTIPGKDTPHILQFAICDTEDSGLDSGVFAKMYSCVGTSDNCIYPPRRTNRLEQLLPPLFNEPKVTAIGTSKVNRPFLNATQLAGTGSPITRPPTPSGTGVASLGNGLPSPKVTVTHLITTAICPPMGGKCHETVYPEHEVVHVTQIMTKPCETTTITKCKEDGKCHIKTVTITRPPPAPTPHHGRHPPHPEIPGYVPPTPIHCYGHCPPHINDHCEGHGCPPPKHDTPPECAGDHCPPPKHDNPPKCHGYDCPPSKHNIPPHCNGYDCAKPPVPPTGHHYTTSKPPHHTSHPHHCNGKDCPPHLTVGISPPGCNGKHCPPPHGNNTHTPLPANHIPLPPPQEGSGAVEVRVQAAAMFLGTVVAIVIAL